MYDLLWAPDEMSDCSDTKQQLLPRFHLQGKREKYTDYGYIWQDITINNKEDTISI